MKKFKAFLALAAILSFILVSSGAIAAPAFYNLTVAVTSTNTVVTPTAANGKALFVRILNDGSGAIYADFDRVAVAASSTAIKILPCEGRDISLDGYGGLTTLGLITDSGVTASARVQIHYMRAQTDPTIPPFPMTQDRVKYVKNEGCSLAGLTSSNGASFIPYQLSEQITLATGAATTDSTANLLLANSIIDAVTCRVTTTITTSVTWQISDPTTAGRFSATSASMTAGSTIVGLAHMFGVVTTTAAGPTQAADAKLRLTMNVNPGAGVVRCTVFGRTVVAPTS